jgi:putative membrane protein
MSDPELKMNDQLAIDRTRLAADRSLMAWIRTALSMITFGFTLYKFLEAMHAQSPVAVPRPDAPRNVGLLLVGIGTFAVAVATVQHWRYLAKLRPGQIDRRCDLAVIVAILISLLGILIFVSMVYTGGPFA